MEVLELDYSEIVSLLTKAEFFSRLLPDDLYWLATRSSHVRYSKDEAVFKAGETATRFYIISSGSITVSREVKGGDREIMAHFVAGDVLGDFDFARRAIYDASAYATEASTVLVFPDFTHTTESMAEERPDVSARLLLRSVSMISSRVRSTQILISENAPWVRELRKQMYTDAPTGLWNRGFLDEELPRKILRSGPVLFLLIKPDKFKELCDTWGHGAGDLAMKHIAEILKQLAAETGGWAIRLQSNETALVVPRCNPDNAVRLTARVSEAFSAIVLKEEDLKGDSDADPSKADALPPLTSFKFTSSLSFSLWPDDSPTLKRLLERTYATLMGAWRDGGNRAYRTRRKIRGTEA